jgi:putative peptidoglycan lipid II flippase
MMLSLVLSRFLGLIRDIIMARMFGASLDTDAYRLAFQVPDLLFFLIAGGALSSAFIPVFSEYLHTGREKDAWKVFSVVTTVMSIIVFGFIVLAWIFAPQLARLVAPGKPDELMPLITYMSRIVLPSQFAFFIGGIMFGTLYARQVFTVPGLGPNVYNIGIIFGAVVLSSLTAVPIVGMSWGALIGAFIGNLLIPMWAMRKIGVQFTPSLDLSHPGVRKVFRLMAPVVLGLSLPGVYALIMQAYGSYYQAGVNTWLEYSNKLMQMPLGVFGQSLAIAIFPALSQFFAQERMDMFRSQLSLTLRQVLFLTVPVAVFMALAATPMIAALYQSGEFTAEDTRQVANSLILFSFGIPAWCLHPVLMRAFFAVQDTKTPIILGTLTTFLFVGLIYALAPTGLGFLVLPLAGSISAIALVIALLAYARVKVGHIDFAGLLLTLGKSVFASIAFGLVTWLVLVSPLGSVSTGDKLTSVLALLLIAVPGGAAYIWVSRLLKMPESKYVDRAFARFTKKGGAPKTPPEEKPLD